MPMPLSPAEMSWEDIKQLVASLAVPGAETDRRMQETDRKLREVGRHPAQRP